MTTFIACSHYFIELFRICVYRFQHSLSASSSLLLLFMIQLSSLFLQTPLHLAIVTGLNTTVTLLIQHKVNVTVQNNEKETPYHLATKLGKNSCLKLICEKASVDSLNLLDGSGKSALHWAIETQNMEAFDVLLGKGVDVNLKVDTLLLYLALHFY